jgi:hypothetical protein
MKTIELKSLFGADVLAGASKGMADLAKLVALLPLGNIPVIVALDFAEIKVATASYLRELVIGFRNYCANNRIDIYPVVTNANAVVLEELYALMSSLRDAVVTCVSNSRGQLGGGKVIGLLDEKERDTLNAVLSSPGTDAIALNEAFKSSDKVSPNAWSNRLAALVEKRILVEQREGRRKRYTPVLEELTYGS